jgi:predicted tellurium resistance membrane protein TerC
MNWTDLSWMSDPKAWIGLVSLTFLQVVLGVDNIVLLTILSGQLPSDQQRKARQLGLIAAMISRIVLLVVLLWVSNLLQKPFVTIGGVGISGKSIILIAGGIFLIGKATVEITAKMEGDEDGMDVKAAPTLAAVLVQLFVLDIVFSLDSVITAIGMVKIVLVQVLAVVGATAFMLFGIHQLADFIDRHPSLKMLALSFLVLIGVNLVAEACGLEIPRGYTYFAMAWSVLVEMVNLRIRKKRRDRKNLAETVDQAIEPGA